MKQKRFCPNCGSDWVEPDTSNRAEVAFSGGNPNSWQCNECGYTGLMPEGDPEDTEEGEEIEFQNNPEVRRVNTGFGMGYAKYVVYILLPAMILYALFKLYIV